MPFEFDIACKNRNISPEALTLRYDIVKIDRLINNDLKIDDSIGNKVIKQRFF